MRLVPKKWSTEAWWCSMRGHLTPAAWVGTLRDQDKQLGLSVDAQSRSCRCLRCDAWIRTQHPEPEQVTSPFLPSAEDLPKPARGALLDEIVVIRLISLERWLHCVAFALLSASLLALQLGLVRIHQLATELLAGLHAQVLDARPASAWLSRGLTELENLDRGHISLLLYAAIGYAILEGVEAFFLWRGKRWAEYLTVLATALLLPVAIQALIDKVTVVRLAGLLIDVAILAYLVWTKRLFGVRGGNRALQEKLAADVDWSSIYRRPPVLPLAALTLPEASVPAHEIPRSGPGPGS